MRGSELLRQQWGRRAPPRTRRALLASDPLVIDAGVAPLPLNWLDVDGDGNVTELLPVDFAGNPRVSRARSDLDAIEVVP